MKRLLSTKAINLLLASVACFVLLVFILNDFSNTSLPLLEQRTEADTSPDFFLIDTTTRQYDEQGLLSHTMQSDSVYHRPEDNTALIRQPFFTLYEQGQATWTIKANSGIVHSDGNRIDLEQRVVIASHDEKNTMKTPAMTVLTDDQLALTDKPVTLLGANGFTRSIGLKADLKNQEVHLLKQVRGQYSATE